MTVDLTQAPWNVPVSAKWALMTGITIMTRGSNGAPSGFGVIFRTPGDTSVTCTQEYYSVQALADPGGVRAGATILVPLVNGRYEFCWHITAPQPAFPIGPTYSFNPSLRGWMGAQTASPIGLMAMPEQLTAAASEPRTRRKQAAAPAPARPAKTCALFNSVCW